MMLIQDWVLPSTFGLTCLLFIGLGFFIRASTKDRTETALFHSELGDVALLERLQQYFSSRAYQVSEVDADSGRVTLTGTVGASVFLAVFLGGLAGVGLGCLSLVIAIAQPNWGTSAYALLLGAPAASWFYWRGATRQESVVFQLDPPNQKSERKDALKGTELMVSAHRDELITLVSKLPLKRVGAE